MRVLIVDDELEIREGLKTKFPWADYGIEEISTAEDGEMALAAAREWKPELIVTDIKMQRMTGLEFIQLLAAERAEGWRSIVISGYDDFDMVRQAMKLGAMDYVLKPINITELGEVVRKAIGQLEREQLERTNQTLMDRHVQNAMTIMREELLREMLEHPHSASRESRIVHRLQTLQLEWMIREKMAVMVMEVDDLKAIENRRDRSEKGLILFGIGNVVKQTLEEDSPLPATLCQDARGRWIIMVGCPDQQAMEQCKELAQLCIERVNRFVKAKVSVGLCSLFGSYQQLHELFAESSGILEQKAVYGGNRLLTSQGWEEEATQDNPSVRNPDEVLDLIRYGSDEDIAGLMDGFVEMVQSWSLSHSRDIHQQIFEWLLHVYKKAAQFGWQDRSWERNPIALWEQLEQYDTLESLRDKVEQLLLAVARDFRGYASSPSQIIQEADRYIAKHYSDGLTLQSVAAEVHVTPVWLSKLFKKEKGKTFLEHVTDVRMEHAKRMLSDVQFKIYQVASRVGYKDPVHFTKLFKKQMGCTPKEYRNMQGIADD
ncbi:two component transcriptional regulator, AraC family [Paenibacillus curdlanolyticus YK9]|uniref:Two component transcriptional regulator, AraC family n=1 Tax=Paenibacillus curdlanolyticus YK9 TaxID=717606 RepID=E0I878_9BACL|nr:response regulator [Paenibacillus curdlanolyticus]EFM11383.1 two component transcriptional regulator, AraC family [Paenibacillus curdlanolyticus YK9]